jgi:hypothetical protein
MKTITIKSFTLFVLMLASIAVLAQDKIYKKNNEVILCEITELGEDEVKYTMEETDDLIYVIDKDRIEKIVFEGGKEMVFSKKMTDPELYLGQNKNAFKVGMFSPMLGALSLSYERSLKPGNSVEGTLGLIGVGIDEATADNPAGAYIKAGYKFISTPDFDFKGMKYSHILKGGYVKPEFTFATYQRDISSYNGQGAYTYSRENIVAGALLLNFGKQWVMSNVFLIDIYGGIGYGFDNMKSVQNSYEYGGPTYHYGFTVGSNVPIALSAGFKVGFLTK